MRTFIQANQNFTLLSVFMDNTDVTEVYSGRKKTLAPKNIRC